MRALIIDDERLARKELAKLLEEHPSIEIVGEAMNADEAEQMINELNPDLLFLDIQMPGRTGFQLLESLESVPLVVFTTAYDEFALKAFDLNAVDYLMKPFSKQRLRQAVDKVVERFKSKTSGRGEVQRLVEQMQERGKPLERIVVKSGSKIHVIPVEAIEQIEAQDDYVMIHSAEGRFMKKETMAALEQSLPEDQFLRIHRSHIVNINQIQRIEQYGKENYLLILKNGNSVSVSKSRIKDLKRELDF